MNKNNYKLSGSGILPVAGGTPEPQNFILSIYLAGLPMPGLIEVRKNAAIGQVIEDILVLAEFEGDLIGQVYYVPL